MPRTPPLVRAFVSLWIFLWTVLWVALSPGAPLRGDFVAFESGHVQPLALSPSADLLFAVNTPDNRLEVFRVTPGGLERAGEAVVGLEPVAVAARSETEVYVVNHLSDSVSVVDVTDPQSPFVRATLLVGDEPRGIAIGGPERDRIFVATAHRGQNSPWHARISAELRTPGIGRADVYVFDAADLAAPETVITLFTDTPRALAVSADGTRVYAAGFHSGNQTTVLTQAAVSTGSVNNVIDDGFAAPGMPSPTAIQSGPDAGVEAPETGTILKLNPADGRWRDANGRDWTPRTRFNLPDKDVFVIDATLDPPAEIPGAVVRGVGTVIFNLAVNPATGSVYASNLEAQNHIRFEPAVTGHIAENRITIITGTTASPVHLNPHIDYGPDSGPEAEIAESLAFPLDMEFTGDGETLYVAAFGSRKVGVLGAGAAVLDRIEVGGGPSGLALDETRGRLYVMLRFEHEVAIVDTDSHAVTHRVPLRFDPEPASVRAGRPVLYDAVASGHGDSACASCHIFGDFDSLAWDLGDPAGEVVENPLERVSVQGGGDLTAFHPMKGPMTTQSLRGMAGAGAMHWRGDRNGPNLGTGADPFDEEEAFMHFRPAFQGLLGKASELPVSEMEKFRDFILQVRYPPSPVRNIDGSLTAEQAAGKQIFDSNGSRTGLGGDGDACADCHDEPLGTAGFGSFELETQDFKVAHLRNLYQKVGMFGLAVPSIVRSPFELEAAPTPHLGDQVRGTGFLHDGSIPTLSNFFRVAFFPDGSPIPLTPFTFPDAAGRTGLQKVRELEAFLHAFDTGLAPSVGHQVTLDAASPGALVSRYGVLRDRSSAGDSDLVVLLANGGSVRGYLWEGAGRFQSDRAAEEATEAELNALIAAGAVATVTAVPPGCGERIALDRDRDGHFDRDELDLGSDPADPQSIPGGLPLFLRGNCNGDQAIDISDAVFGLFVLFLEAGPPPCADACDADGNLVQDLTDSTYVLNFLFTNGTAPVAPFPGCGPPGVDCAQDACPDGL